VTTSPSPPINVMCTLQTNCVTSLVGPRAPGEWPGTPAPPITAAGGLALLLALVLRERAAGSQRRGERGAWVARVSPLLATFALLLLVMTWTACASNPPRLIPNAPATPAGVYQIQLVATAPGGVKQTVTLMVHVL